MEDLKIKLKELKFSQLKEVSEFCNELIEENNYYYKIWLSELLRKIFNRPIVLEFHQVDDEIIQIVEEMLLTLTPRQQEILRRHYGLGTYGEKFTQKEIGEHFVLTDSRISQIEKGALRKLRHPSRSRRLKAFLEGKQKL